ncbi:MAG: lasso peptide biosynthesis B2 protein [Hyphomicrobiales bacterium]|jgi:hypothetical protein|nr:MAG: lasso peptide biosynthesis B2 protein [Hyphomicrobiales bacterium]
MAFVLMPIFWLALQVLGFKSFMRWFIGAPSPGRAPVSHDDVVKIARLVNTAGFHLFGSDNCLIRSLYLAWLLRRLGVMCELRIGTRLAPGRLMGHAWIEVAGVPVNDAADVGKHYAVFEKSFT